MNKFGAFMADMMPILQMKMKKALPKVNSEPERAFRLTYSLHTTAKY